MKLLLIIAGMALIWAGFTCGSHFGIDSAVGLIGNITLSLLGGAIIGLSPSA